MKHQPNKQRKQSIITATKSTLIKIDVPLHNKNWFATGGRTSFFAAPTNAREFQQALQFAQQKELPIFVLGQGANILISDAGFEGLVIQPQITDITIDGPLVTAGAGVHMHDLIIQCLDHHLIGLEEFSGIPGTVGGSVYINLHYFEFLLEQFLVSAQVINKQTGTIMTVDHSWFAFGYNQSTLHEQDYFLLEATFQLKEATELEIAFAHGRRKEIIRHRTARYPTKYTCGSFFRNFHEDEVDLVINGKKMIYVAYYLDKIGIKGDLHIGNAMVSHQHANMFVHGGNATSDDIVRLALTIQELVKGTFGIVPQPECRLIGFTTYPLLER